jgi:hypothetical protein
MPPPTSLIAAAALLDSNISHASSVERDNKLKGKTMKRIIIGLACAVIAPFAFAQTSTTTSEQTTTTAPATTTTTSTTYTAGTVTTYEPEKTIVVRSESEGPLSFALHAPVRIVDKAGHVVKRALTPKDKVRVYYTGTGDTRVVEHVEVED